MINICKIYLNYVKKCENLITRICMASLPDNNSNYSLDGDEYKILNIDCTMSLETCTDIVNNEMQASEIVYMQNLLEIHEYNWLKCIFMYKNMIFVFDFELFKMAKHEKKIMVARTWLFPVNAPKNSNTNNYYQVFVNNKDFIAQSVSMNILYCPEISGLSEIRDLIPAIDLPNTIFIGQSTTFKYALNIPFHWWLLETVHVNMKSWVLNRQLDLLNYNAKKPIFFDCLMGKPKQYRINFYQKIQKKNLLKYCLVTAHNWPKGEYENENSFSINKKFVEAIKKEYPKLRFVPDKINENRVIVECLPDSTYKFSLGDVYLALSQLLDLDIYNQTAYSIVLETLIGGNDNGINETYLMTEKICKPILAKRMFLVVGVTNYLRNLRNLGFKTFDSIIDESYDEVIDPDERQELVIQEMEKLFGIDQEIILQKIEPIVQHNFYHLMKLYYNDDMNYLLRQFW